MYCLETPSEKDTLIVKHYGCHTKIKAAVRHVDYSRPT